MKSSREGGLCLGRFTQKDEAWDLDQSPPQVPVEPTRGSPYFLKGSVTKRSCERGLWQSSLPPTHPPRLLLFPDGTTQQGSLCHCSKATLREPGMTHRTGHIHVPGGLPPHKLCVSTSLCAWGVYRGHQVQEFAHCTSSPSVRLPLRPASVLHPGL